MSENKQNKNDKKINNLNEKELKNTNQKDEMIDNTTENLYF